MKYIRPFDPWGSPLCDCPPKWSLNPYTGCSHHCLYCYSSSFIPNFYNPRPKKNFLEIVKRDLEKLPANTIISLSNSSDPYQPLEKTYQYTRIFLELISDFNFPLLILTKSDLILRDIDQLSKLSVAISITITTKRIAHLLEGGAPSYERRVLALTELRRHGFPLVLRLDPVIPGLNDKEAVDLLDELLPLVDHVVLSTYKARHDSLRRLKEAFPKEAQNLSRLYLCEGIKLNGSFYLSKTRRQEILTPLIEKIKAQGKTYSLCREGLSEHRRKGYCDGSFLIWKFFNICSTWNI